MKSTRSVTARIDEGSYRAFLLIISFPGARVCKTSPKTHNIFEKQDSTHREAIYCKLCSASLSFESRCALMQWGKTEAFTESGAMLDPPWTRLQRGKHYTIRWPYSACASSEERLRLRTFAQGG